MVRLFRRLRSLPRGPLLTTQTPLHSLKPAPRLSKMLASPSPFSNPSRPTLSGPPASSPSAGPSAWSLQAHPAYNSGTTHPAALFPRLPGVQRRVHVSSAAPGGPASAGAGGLACEQERSWVEQWTAARRDWHPACLSAVPEGSGLAAQGQGERAGHGQDAQRAGERAKL